MDDAKNIALGKPGADGAQEVMDLFVLEEISAAARIGFAFAIAQQVPPDEPISGTREHNFTVATIDKKGEFPDLLVVFYPDEDWKEIGPYRTVEILMNRGLIQLGRKIQQDQIQDVEDLLEAARVDDQ